MASVVPVRTGATEGRPELYPENRRRVTLSTCRRVVERVYPELVERAPGGSCTPVLFVFEAAVE